MSEYNVAQRRPEYMGQTAEQVITKAKKWETSDGIIINVLKSGLLFIK